MPYCIFLFQIRGGVLQKSQQEPGDAPSWRQCADDANLLLCEAAVLRLRLFRVCWPGARLQLLLSLEVA